VCPGRHGFDIARGPGRDRILEWKGRWVWMTRRIAEVPPEPKPVESLTTATDLYLKFRDYFTADVE
jgi:hypothetical protein